MGSFSATHTAGARPSQHAARRLPHRIGLEAAPAPGDVLVGAHQIGGAGPGAVAGMRRGPRRRRGRPGRRSSAARSARRRITRVAIGTGSRARARSALGRRRVERVRLVQEQQQGQRPAPAAGAASRALAAVQQRRVLGMASRAPAPAAKASRSGVIERREAESGRRRKAAAVDHAAREVVVLGERQHGIAIARGWPRSCGVMNSVERVECRMFSSAATSRSSS